MNAARQKYEARVQLLAKMSWRTLVRIVRAHGVTGAQPLETWSRDDLTATLLSIEFPTTPQP